jgi:hypothetical protein
MKTAAYFVTKRYVGTVKEKRCRKRLAKQALYLPLRLQ